MAQSTCPRCSAAKPSSMFACKPCWFELPQDVRKAIAKAYSEHGPLSAEWCAAAEAAFPHWGIDETPRWLETMKEVAAD